MHSTIDLTYIAIWAIVRLLRNESLHRHHRYVAIGLPYNFDFLFCFRNFPPTLSELFGTWALSWVYFFLFLVGSRHHPKVMNIPAPNIPDQQPLCDSNTPRTLTPHETQVEHPHHVLHDHELNSEVCPETGRLLRTSPEVWRELKTTSG
jgi:hypothetical protein